MLGLRHPGFEFRILCVEGSVISLSHHPQEVFLARFSLYVHKSGIKPDSFHFIYLAGYSVNDTDFTPVNTSWLDVGQVM